MTDLTHTSMPSPFGELKLVVSPQGLVAILWPDDDRWSYDSTTADSDVGSQARAELEEFFAGDRTDFSVPLDLRGTDFQVAAWHALAEIPFGETVSYAEQAKRIGRPKAVRAIGAANGKNPVSIILPCHRVVGSNGKLTGYAGGLDAKRWLLTHEGAQQTLV